jgi:DNA (cytosine-5)-methyltransferase 1
MKHLGDITKINGHDVPIVDIVTGGSPCQDLSVAGLRKGLQHSALGDGETTRSGLFMEQIRIIKEMRDESTKQLRMRGADVDRGSIRPRYMVWENVPGAFSSNGGEDFRAVLEETAKVADKDAIIPRPSVKWSSSGCIMGDGWSIAWRVHDAQFWGVPQRRKRISLVADFGGESAPEILFERSGVSGDSEESREKKQDSSRPSEADSCETISFQERAGCEGGARVSSFNMNVPEPYQPSTTSQCLNGWDVQSKHIQPENGKAEALYSGECRGGGGESYVYCLQGNGIDRADTAGCNGKGWREDQSYTLNTIDRPAVCVGIDAYNQTETGDKAMSITGAATDSHHIPCVNVTYQETTGTLSPGAHAGSYNGQDAYNDMLVVSPTYGLDRASFNQGQNAKYDFSVQEEIAQPIVARGPGGVLTTQ